MSSDINVVEVKNVQKKFRIYHERKNTIFESLTSLFNRQKYFEEILVLNDISFSVKKGEMIGIIGLNGSGKTTLLKIIGGIYYPNKGKVITRGTTIPFLELGAGFQPELTAKENIILYGIILGFTKKQISEKVYSIIKFAELEKFADTKIKNFSSGMYARLAFATAVQVDPDILLIDEILSVGDLPFQKKSFETFMSFKRRGKSIIFVSHSLDTIRDLCDKAIFIHKGIIHSFGKPSVVINTYRRLVDTVAPIQDLRDRVKDVNELPQKIDEDVFALRPWVDDFSKLGINTGMEEISIGAVKNQRFREPVIIEFLEIAFKELDGMKPSLLDMYCNNAYYSLYSMKKFQCGRVVAIDNDELRVEGAKLMSKKLDLTNIEIKIQDAATLYESEKFDIVLNLDGLHTVSNPKEVLDLTNKLTKKFAIISSVISLENTNDDYFQTPAPDWTWGCRFSEGMIRKWIEDMDWKIVKNQTGILEHNHSPRDRGSVFYLCKKN